MKYKYFIVNKAVLNFDNQHDNQHLTFKVFHNHKLIFLYLSNMVFHCFPKWIIYYDLFFSTTILIIICNSFKYWSF